MATNESTTKFKVDISDLKKGMQEASRQVRLANSEFKAATAGMDDWSKSSEGLTAKLAQLDKVLVAQKSKLSILQNQYEATVKEQGKESKGAQELAIKINNQMAAVGKTEAEIKKYNSELSNAEKGNKAVGKSADEMSNDVKSSTDGFTVLKGALSSLVADGVRVAVAGLKKLGSTAVEVGKEAVGSYADYEQLIGGVETLFKKSAGTVQKYAENAYKTAGMSANDYMDTVTSFSASLLQSLDGDTRKSAKYADTAIKDMADNANKMGTDISSLQNAYQGFAKQNYTMLDNLKLGYGGTQKEMYRLMMDAKKLGVTFDKEVTLDSKGHLEAGFSDMVKAIHAVQQNLDITGTTMKEAEHTISGSVNTMKGAWSNLLRGMVDDNADFDEMINNFVNSVITASDNLLPRVKLAISGIGKLVTQLITKLGPEITAQLPSLFGEIIPALSQAGTSMFNTLVSALPGMLSPVISNIPTVINTLLSATPQLLQIGTSVLLQLIQGMVQAIPELTTQMSSIIQQICDILIENGPLLIQAAVQLISGLASGISQALPVILPALTDLIVKLTLALVNATPQIVEAGVTLLSGIIKALPIILNKLISALPQIIDAILDVLTNSLDLILNAAIELFLQLVLALPQVIESLSAALPDLIDAIVDFLCDNVDLILDAGITLLFGIIDAIPKILPSLLKAIVTIPLKIGRTLIKKAPELAKTAMKFFGKLPAAIPKVATKVFTAVKDLLEGLWEKFKDAPSKMLDIGKNLIEGLWNGIKDMSKWIYDKIKGFGEGVLNTLKDFFGINSPSKLMRDQVGKWIARGIVAGIKKEEKNTIREVKKSAAKITDAYVSSFTEGLVESGRTISKVASDVVKDAYNILANAQSTFKFEDAGSSAGTAFSNAVASKSEYLLGKIDYQNTSRLSEWQATIDGYQKTLDYKTKVIDKQSSKDTKAVEKERDKEIKKLEAERDKKVKKLESKKDKTSDSSTKKKLDKQIKTIKENYAKKINIEKKQATKDLNAIKSNSKATTNAIKAQYSGLIESAKTQMNAYSEASSKFIEGFRTAMSNYQTQAEGLVNDVIGGITGTYQARYDELIDKQNELISKMQEAGDLFNISDAGVLTLGDITTQTAEIKSYAESLRAIKDKVSSELFDEITKLDMKEGKAFISQLMALPEEELQAYSDAYTEKLSVADDLANEIYSEDFTEVADAYRNSLDDAFAGLPEQLQTLGTQVLQGFVEGMTGDTDYITGEVKSFIDEMLGTFREQLGIASPSKVMKMIGEFTGEGFVEGIKGTVKDVKKAAVSLADVTAGSLEGLKANIGTGAGNSSSSVVNNYNLVQNNNSPRSLSALETYQARRQQIAMVKAMTVV